MRMKRTIKEVYDILKELDTKYGIKTHHVEVALNKRLTKSLGRCHFANKQVVKFDFSMLAFHLDYEPFKQLVMHEWSHAYNTMIHGGKGHDATFKQVCHMIGCTNDGTTCKDKEALEIARESMPTQQYKYEIVCQGCGCESKFTRKTQAWQVIRGEMMSIGRYRCTKCGCQDLKANKL